ncbi:MAG: rubrerythrin family protein [Candidatus Lokiarchaeota archaeon]|nr:rubrerythrin family protein [Candidatus Lokiarchaeota archaeon]
MIQISIILENLKEAIIGESTAKAKYNLFAIRADEEGLVEIARLFMAISYAEEIHVKNHVKAYEKISDNTIEIEELVKIDEVELQKKVRDTRSNLIQAIAGETYEFRKMYKSFMKNAKKLNTYLAEFSFNLARNAENIHRKLYIDYLKMLDDNRMRENENIYVCEICGNVEIGKLPSSCSICDHDQKFFKKMEN